MIYRIGHSSERIRTHDGRCVRRLSWRYASKGGPTGTDSQLSSPSLAEHRVVVTWSVESGERTVLHDGAAVPGIAPSGPRGSSVLDVAWTADVRRVRSGGGMATMRVVAVAAKPNGSPPDFRCHEMLIDGVCLVDYPKAPGASGMLGCEDDFENEGDRRAGSIVDILYPDGVPERKRIRYEELERCRPSWEMSPTLRSESYDESGDAGLEMRISPPSSPRWKEDIKLVMSVDTCDSVKTWVNDVA